MSYCVCGSCISSCFVCQQHKLDSGCNNKQKWHKHKCNNKQFSMKSEKTDKKLIMKTLLKHCNCTAAAKKKYVFQL